MLGPQSNGPKSAEQSQSDWPNRRGPDQTGRWINIATANRDGGRSHDASSPRSRWMRSGGTSEVSTRMACYRMVEVVQR